jgi:hypothetical protein
MELRSARQKPLCQDAISLRFCRIGFRPFARWVYATRQLRFSPGCLPKNRGATERLSRCPSRNRAFCRHPSQLRSCVTGVRTNYPNIWSETRFRRLHRRQSYFGGPAGDAGFDRGKRLRRDRLIRDKNGCSRIKTVGLVWLTVAIAFGVLAIAAFVRVPWWQPVAYITIGLSIVPFEWWGHEPSFALQARGDRTTPPLHNQTGQLVESGFAENRLGQSVLIHGLQRIPGGDISDTRGIRP